MNEDIKRELEEVQKQLEDRDFRWLMYDVMVPYEQLGERLMYSHQALIKLLNMVKERNYQACLYEAVLERFNKFCELYKIELVQVYDKNGIGPA